MEFESADVTAPSQDKLEAMRNAVRELRDISAEVSDLEDRVKARKARMLYLQTKQLVDLFTEARVERLDLPAEGNLPAYIAEITPFYKANIAADWDEERRSRAFKWLDDNGHGDLIKTEVIINLGRKEFEKAKKVEQWLSSAGIPYVRHLAVPWNTLTAFVREQIEKYQRTPPLELLGATTGSIVNVKEKQ